MTAAPADGKPRRHRGLFWTAVAVAIALIIGGGIFAWTGYAATAGPDGAVRGYFAALQRGDAAAALAFGDIPAGPRTLLTKAVLDQQRDIAQIERVKIRSMQRSGDTARVQLSYVLAFGGGFTPQITDSTVVHHRHGAWKLDASAVAVTVQMAQAADRATLAGQAVAAGPVLLFPGALPIRFDTVYLQVDQASSIVQLNSPGQVNLAVDITPDGRKAVTAALTALLPGCLRGAPSAAPTCPRPSPRAVPGSLRGTLAGPVHPVIAVANGAAGLIDVTADVTVTGSYQLLNFNNIATTKTGRIVLPVHATTYATATVALTWADDSP